ncbi:MAG TPA: tRNA uridine-5-carboxymethylaminomethyl(34) synthesis GTPase MnmE [Candidatus Didemnitutus sp.]|nr:tRNA uridine-5-carboxymethylaminomethyl(34) synthesis GTPase MnmE [Candidatus Didemnitutus sp.]
MVTSKDMIAALATPVGTSAIAVVRASGPGTSALTKAIFGEVPQPRVSRHSDYRDRDARLLDDVLFTFFEAPNSYTGDDTLEISCHGNPYIARLIVADLLARGCRPAEAGEFTRRAFLNGRLDLSQAEAVMDLIHARSERALAAANEQLRGALGRAMERIIAQLVNITARIEAYIDFPEEDLPPEDRRAIQGDLEILIQETNRLLVTGQYGAMVREGIRTVIVGEPNAGKSSLLNRLVGRDRALVSTEPGTTRDYLEETLSVGPHLLRLVDTAGLHEAPSGLERRGIEKTVEQARDAHLFLWVVDATRPFPIPPTSISALLKPTNTVVVFNKCDLPGVPLSESPVAFPHVRVSALTGQNVDGLIDRISGFADSCKTEIGDEIVAINARHSFALERAKSALLVASSKVVGREPVELLASDLREALDAFGEIAGKVDSEAVLDQLFATFCIGK